MSSEIATALEWAKHHHKVSNQRRFLQSKPITGKRSEDEEELDKAYASYNAWLDIAEMLPECPFKFTQKELNGLWECMSDASAELAQATSSMNSDTLAAEHKRTLSLRLFDYRIGPVVCGKDIDRIRSYVSDMDRLPPGLPVDPDVFLNVPTGQRHPTDNTLDQFCRGVCDNSQQDGVICLAGERGSGKSTILNRIAWYGRNYSATAGRPLLVRLDVGVAFDSKQFTIDLISRICGSAMEHCHEQDSSEVLRLGWAQRVIGHIGRFCQMNLRWALSVLFFSVVVYMVFEMFRGGMTALAAHPPNEEGWPLMVKHTLAIFAEHPLVGIPILLLSSVVVFGCCHKLSESKANRREVRNRTNIRMRASEKSAQRIARYLLPLSIAIPIIAVFTFVIGHHIGEPHDHGQSTPRSPVKSTPENDAEDNADETPVVAVRHYKNIWQVPGFLREDLYEHMAKRDELEDLRKALLTSGKVNGKDVLVNRDLDSAEIATWKWLDESQANVESDIYRIWAMSFASWLICGWGISITLMAICIRYAIPTWWHTYNYCYGIQSALRDRDSGRPVDMPWMGQIATLARAILPNTEGAEQLRDLDAPFLQMQMGQLLRNLSRDFPRVVVLVDDVDMLPSKSFAEFFRVFRPFSRVQSVCCVMSVPRYFYEISRAQMLTDLHSTVQQVHLVGDRNMYSDAKDGFAFRGMQADFHDRLRSVLATRLRIPVEGPPTDLELRDCELLKFVLKPWDGLCDDEKQAYRKDWIEVDFLGTIGPSRREIIREIELLHRFPKNSDRGVFDEQFFVAEDGRLQQLKIDYFESESALHAKPESDPTTEELIQRSAMANGDVIHSIYNELRVSSQRHGNKLRWTVELDDESVICRAERSHVRGHPAYEIWIAKSNRADSEERGEAETQDEQLWSVSPKRVKDGESRNMNVFKREQISGTELGTDETIRCVKKLFRILV